MSKTHIIAMVGDANTDIVHSTIESYKQKLMDRFTGESNMAVIQEYCSIWHKTWDDRRTKLNYEKWRTLCPPYGDTIVNRELMWLQDRVYIVRDSLLSSSKQD